MIEQAELGQVPHPSPEPLPTQMYWVAVLAGCALALQLYSLNLPTDSVSCEPSTSRELLLLGIGLTVLSLIVYVRMMKKSLAWSVLGLLVLGLVPVLGPSLFLAEIGLASFNVRRMIRLLTALILIIGMPAFVIVPNYLTYSTRARQSEAKVNLGGIYTAEMAYYQTHKRFGNFSELGFELGGSRTSGTCNTCRYTYRIDRSSAPGTIISGTTTTSGGIVPPDNTIAPPGISLDGQHFTATATGNIDNDATLDQWHINEQRKCLLRADVDDSAK